MNEKEALQAIKNAMMLVNEDVAQRLTMDSDLVSEDGLDSLALVEFTFELENELDTELQEIDEHFNDLKISTLVRIIVDETSGSVQN